jgi:branched-chain amino acid transport system ATP-binding protein
LVNEPPLRGEANHPPRLGEANDPPRHGDANDPPRRGGANDALLLTDIDAYYGDSHVLHRVSLRLGEGRLLGLLGRNGAGKSTCMSVAVGWVAPRRGSVSVYGTPVAGRSPESIAAQGVALVPQGRRVFRSLTVRENLIVAARGPRDGGAAAWNFERVCATFPRLAERRDQYAGHLSGGEQQMLAIGRALMSNPRVLLMDEPSEGLAPRIVAEVMDTIRQLKRHGLSIVLVEQNAKLVFDVADDIVILNSGRVVVAGATETLLRDGLDARQHLGVF